MARARLLKPGFFANEDLALIPFEGRLLFAGLWTLADRKGRLEDRPKRIKAALFPYEEVDVDALLDALSGAEFIVRYEAVGERYIQVASFEKHQQPHHREPESKLPAQGAAWASPGLSLGEPESGPTESVTSNGNQLPEAETETVGAPARLHKSLDDSAVIAELKAEFPQLNVERELAKYRDWKKAKGVEHKDAHAGFKNWLRKAEDDGNGSRKGVGEPAAAAHTDGVAAGVSVVDRRSAAIADRRRRGIPGTG